MAMGSYLSIITLNVNGLNAPTKRQRLTEWIQKQDLYICCLQETHLKTRNTYRLEVKGWKKIFHANGDQKKAGVAILISDKIDFEIKAEKRDKDQIRSDQLLTRVQLFETPWIAARQASLSITNSWTSFRLTSIESVMPCSHLILCRPLEGVY